MRANTKPPVELVVDDLDECWKGQSFHGERVAGGEGVLFIAVIISEK